MNFAYDITTDAGTAATAKKKTVITLFMGVITNVEIQFPRGHDGLAYCHINRALHQVYPANPDGYYHGNDQTIALPGEYELSAEPFQLEVYTWNLDDTYAHTIIIRIDITPAAELVGFTYEELAALAVAREL